MTRTERGRRDAAIIADRASGMGWTTVAERHSVSERHARRIVECGYARHVESTELEIAAIFTETLARIDQTLDELAVLSRHTRNEAVKLGALKARMDVLERRMEVQQTLRRLGHSAPGARVGVIPSVKRLHCTGAAATVVRLPSSAILAE